MSAVTPLAIAAAGATPGAWLLPAVVALPLVGAMLAALLGGRRAGAIVALVCPLGLVLSFFIGRTVLHSDAAIVATIGGISPPLGVSLRADGLSAAMLVSTALIMSAVAMFARIPFAIPPGARETRRSLVFWTLFLGVWGALNTIFVSNDFFSLFVALELLTFSAVPLVAIDGRAETVAAALRYLLFSLLGSVLYLLGTGLLYGTYGVLDLSLLAPRISADPAGLAAIALMTVGLAAKTALFPLHLWLPPAHAGAPPAASALLSALVVKGPYFILLRLWLDLLEGVSIDRAAQGLAALGAAGIMVGSVLALRQARLKMLIAYSTVAQIGYLFFVFPLVAVPAAIGAAEGFTPGRAAHDAALTGGMLQAIAHAFAKGAMFLAAGLIAESIGHDRIADLRGVARALPLTVVAFALGGFSLMGLPPSGGFWAKWLLLSASIASGQWWWALTILCGGLLAGGYLLRVITAVMGHRAADDASFAPVSPFRQSIAVALALVSMLLGLMALAPPNLVAVGRISASTAPLVSASTELPP